MATAALNKSDDFRVKNAMAHIRDAYTERPDGDYLY